MRIEALFRYPVKSLRGLRVDAAEVEPRGLAGDRRWMIVDAHGVFLTQRTLPELARIEVAAFAEGITLTLPGGASAVLPGSHRGTPETVEVWRSRVDAVPHAEGSALLSDFLGRPVRVVFQVGPRPTHRGGGEVSFADGYPLLLTTTSSHAELDAQAGVPIDPRRFRPNVLVTSERAYDEDLWDQLTLGGIPFQGVKGCDRCVLTTVDPESGAKGTEPLRTLARTRRAQGAVWFGMNLVPRGRGTLRVGDPVEVLTRHATPPR
ncbi:MAG: MOSC N-terminal beta barrel domain-containing protein [Myxococcota bacterium]